MIKLGAQNTGWTAKDKTDLKGYYEPIEENELDMLVLVEHSNRRDLKKTFLDRLNSRTDRDFQVLGAKPDGYSHTLLIYDASQYNARVESTSNTAGYVNFLVQDINSDHPGFMVIGEHMPHTSPTKAATALSGYSRNYLDLNRRGFQVIGTGDYNEQVNKLFSLFPDSQGPLLDGSIATTVRGTHPDNAHTTLVADYKVDTDRRRRSDHYGVWVFADPAEDRAPRMSEREMRYLVREANKEAASRAVTPIPSKITSKPSPLFDRAPSSKKFWGTDGGSKYHNKKNHYGASKELSPEEVKKRKPCKTCCGD